MRVFWAAVFAIFLSLPASAAESAAIQQKDQNSDVVSETHIIYDHDLPKRSESDWNHDGQVDEVVQFKKGMRFLKATDTDFNGTEDTWAFYDAKGHLMGNARDTNNDGKPDQFRQLLRGRDLILREFDRNFDGKIDMKKVSEWGIVRRATNQPPVPSYVTLEREEDNNYDGLVDSYYYRYDRQSTKKIGKPI